VDVFHDAWAKDRDRKGRRSERGRYFSHVEPVIGVEAITAVAKDDARAIAAALDDKVTAGELHRSTAVKAWGVVKKMFRDAAKSKVAALRVLEASPFEGVQGPDRGEKKGKQWLFPDEVSALLACPQVPLRWRRRVVASSSTRIPTSKPSTGCHPSETWRRRCGSTRSEPAYPDPTCSKSGRPRSA
jgi:hypothetical protein